MKIEYEVKILDIDVDEIAKKLKKLGARKVSEKILRRYTYDFTPRKENSWIRLRDEGDKVTLAIKEIHDDSVEGTHEHEVGVSSFAETNELLNLLGYRHKQYQENKRVSYTIGDTHIEIDYWPQIPPYLEIEGSSKEEVEKIVSKLGFEMSGTTSINTMEVYRKYGIDLQKIRDLRLS
jgi:adenylate cyclase class 2